MSSWKVFQAACERVLNTSEKLVVTFEAIRQSLKSFLINVHDWKVVEDLQFSMGICVSFWVARPDISHCGKFLS